MIRGIADYFGTEFFDRSQEIVIATYEKAVQHFSQRLKEPGEKHAPRYPFIVFDPGMDFEPDPQAGRFFHGYPHFLRAFAIRLIKPYIYEDDNIVVAPVLNRYRGRFDIIVWCSSVYELIDFRFLVIQMFGGQERIIYPRNILGQIIMPDEILGYEYNNPYTKVNYTLDWEANGSEVQLIRNINDNKMIFPFTFRPWIKMVDISDGAEKFGGSGDELSEYRLNIGLEWECSIPTHISMLAIKEPIFDNILELNVDIGYSYKCDFKDPITGEVINTINMTDTISNVIGKDDEEDEDNKIVTSEWAYFKDRYKYTITETDINNMNLSDPINPVITLTESVSNGWNVRLYGKYGPMNRSYHWNLISDTEVELVSVTLKDSFDEGDEIWIAMYEGDE